MHTSNNYYQFQAQSKMRQLQHQADIHRQLKQIEKPKFSPISINQVKQLFLVLKSKLVRPVYILKHEKLVNN
jgi:hypothetical protein